MGGTPMVTNYNDYYARPAAPPLWLGLVAFGALSDRLLEQRKGEALTVYGRLQVSRWESAGEAREQLQVVIETLLSARTVAQREGSPTSPQRDPAPVEP